MWYHNLMRIVPNSITDAITIPESVKETGRLTAYKSRVFFSTYTDEAPAYASPIPGPSAPHAVGYPLPEALAYNTELGKFITISIKTNGEIALQIEGEASPVIVTMGSSPLLADEHCRPGILENSFWFYSPEDVEYSTGSWYKVVFDPALVLLGTAECVESLAEFSSRPNGAIHPISDTEAVIFHIDEGGIRPVFVASDASEHEHPGRLFNPTHVFTPYNADDLTTLQFSGATILNGDIFVYLTMYNGSVKVAKYKFAADNINGSWSDFLVAVPEDISVFEIGSVFTYNNRVFMCGKFYRQEEFATTTKYTLLLWSDDGFTFSIDRKTLVSAIDLRFLAVMEGDYLTFSSTNRYTSVLAPYQILGESAESVAITLDNISGASQSGWSAKVKASDEVYLDNVILETGVYAKFEIGVYTTNGIEWVKYHDVIVSRITSTFEDGVRRYTVNIVPDALWHTSMMTHPFYMEIQGKQSVLDTVQALDNLYKVESGGGIPWTLSCDFWTKEITESAQGGFIYQTHAAAIETDWWCPDIKEFATDYPILGSDTTIEVRIYGWSRAGIPSGAPGQNPVDDTPTDTPNDDFYALMLLEDENGMQSTVVSTIDEIVSEYTNPPQSWFVDGAREGSYPVIWQIANPGTGKKIIKVGCRVIANTGNTTYNLERVELPGITVIYNPTTTPSSPSAELVDSPTDDYGYFTIGEGPYNSNTIRPPLPDPSEQFTFFETQISTPFDATHHYSTGFGVDNKVAVDAILRITLRTEFRENNEIEGFRLENYPDSVKIYTVNGVDYNETSVANITSGDASPRMCYYTNMYFASNPHGRLPEICNVYFTVEVLTPGGVPIAEIERTKNLQITKKGRPTVYFSQRPFSTWNFDCISRTSFTGEYALSGLLGLASDDNNYIVGYIENGKIGIGVIRGGVKTTLVDVVDATIVPDTIYDVRFWHRDGVFGVETKKSTSVTWPTRGSQLTYSWLEVDGVMATIDDIFHVGVFTFINPPKFRTVGFRSSGSIIPILPLDINPSTGASDALTLFPWSGQIDIEGTKYSYNGIWPTFTDVSIPYTEPLGPYQLRSVGNVVAPYSNPPTSEGDDNPMTGAGGRCIAILQFAWLENTVENEGLFAGAAIGSTNGYAFFENAAQWKIWITTNGKLVWIRERARHYVEDQYADLIGDDFGTLSSKIYITNGMDGVAPIDKIENEFVYEEGTFVFLDSDDKIDVYGFYAVSGDHDQNLKSLLGKFCKIAGTTATFPGDFAPANATIASGGQVNLQ